MNLLGKPSQDMNKVLDAIIIVLAVVPIYMYMYVYISYPSPNQCFVWYMTFVKQCFSA